MVRAAVLCRVATPPMEVGPALPGRRVAPASAASLSFSARPSPPPAPPQARGGVALLVAVSFLSFFAVTCNCPNRLSDQTMRLTSFVLPPPVTWKGLVLAVGALGHSTEHRRSALSRPALPLEDELPNQSLLPAACYPIEMECDTCEIHPAWSEYFGEEIWLCVADHKHE
mmetsp:Transcript_36451/g.117481  ORF Transcript_36451/g.117481 Transcript_36451/m.117481 type:complete len:170 (-) Transcript_36451:231-740(-)